MATRGRPKRARSKSAGNGILVRPHKRKPRGPNRGKPVVKVDGYRRGRPKRKARDKRA